MTADEMMEVATHEFNTDGLGGIISRRVQALSAAASRGFIGVSKSTYVSFIAGNIIERTLWLALGRWIGNLRPTATVSEVETRFLTQHLNLLLQGTWPPIFRSIMGTLVSVNDQVLTFGDNWLSFEVGKNDTDLAPIFQSASILAEDLNNELITSFFIFLREGHMQTFPELMPDADKVLNCLKYVDSPDNPLVGFELPEAVLAGFMRYTEFLSAMNSLFPTAEDLGDNPMDRSERIAKREMLAVEVKDLIDWRFPKDERSLELYKSVRTAFFSLVRREFERYPELGIQWAEEDSRNEIIRLTERFFGVSETYAKLKETNPASSPAVQPLPKQLPTNLP